MPNYQIAIPSYKRASLCNNKTLAFLQREGIDKQRIHVFVADDEYDEYLATLHNDRYNKLLIGAVGLVGQREKIEEYFAKDECILFLDDDLEGINMELSCFYGVSLNEFILAGFAECRSSGANIWGVYPVNNNFFMETRPDVNYNLSYICGNFYGLINRKLPELRLTITRENGNKEDVERTLLYWKTDNKLVRFERVSTKTKYYGTDGGGLGKFNDRLKHMAEATDRLLAIYGDYGKKYVRKNGMTEFKFSGQPTQR